MPFLATLKFMILFSITRELRFVVFKCEPVNVVLKMKEFITEFSPFDS